MIACLRSWTAAVTVLLGLALLCTPGAARAQNSGDTVRGTTTPTLIETGAPAPAEEPGPFPLLRLDREPLAAYPELSLRDSSWVLVDTDTFLTYLPIGEACVIHFEPPSGTVSLLEPADPVVALARQAIDYAPDWLAVDLRDAFGRMDAAHQETFAGVILAAEDPTVDEVAFVVAHTALEVLEAGGFYPELLSENAADVYAHDAFLDYVDIVDYGSAAVGGDYYSTVVYRTADNGDTTEVELPRGRYYWDIVHPKITDEFPTYINPATGGAADPPTGQFWRDFLYAQADSGYPLLKGALAGCQVLWEGNMDSRTNGAIGILTQWILDVMDFGSGAERPIQPVRIYRKHLGRCGEHADITAAAARACLIATNSASAICEDHTWNEFYDQRWVAWEPVNVYVDSPWHYEGWGKSFIGIFDWRGDDWTWTVTDNGYTPACTLTVAVTDSFGYPVDGAEVNIALKVGNPAYQVSTWASTDCNGLCEFTLGDNQDLYYRIDSPIGTVPPGPMYKLAVAGTLPGEHYEMTKAIPSARPQLPVTPAALPPEPTDEYQVRVTWGGTGEYIYGENRLDYNTFSDARTSGRAEFFLCDSANYAAYVAGNSFDAYYILEDAQSADVTFTLPAEGDWYAVLSNEEHVVNSEVVRGTAELFRRSTTEVAERGADSRAATALTRIWPNPFAPRTEVTYSLANPGRVDISVYDVQGRLVRTLVTGSGSSGEHRVEWDGTDAAGIRVAPGVYLCVLETPGTRLSRKMVVVR